MRPLALLILALAAAPAFAGDELDAGWDASRAVGACLASDPDLRQWVHAYPQDAQQEFYALYRAYADMVKRRRGEGWSSGGFMATGNFKTNTLNDIRRYGWRAVYKQSPQWESSRTRLEEEYASTQDPERKKELKLFLDGRFGTCNDWSRETQEVLFRQRPRHFVVHARILEGAASHAYTLVCPAGQNDEELCISFDPWKRGLPDLYRGSDAKKGPSSGGCFSTAEARRQLEGA